MKPSAGRAGAKGGRYGGDGKGRGWSVTLVNLDEIGTTGEAATTRKRAEHGGPARIGRWSGEGEAARSTTGKRAPVARRTRKTRRIQTVKGRKERRASDLVVPKLLRLGVGSDRKDFVCLL